ncbi:MAG: hypothetical protein K2O60_07590 [Ruminococcus sp.]|nr:hypothetical protein [Ruminococcus sp.]
MKKTNKKTKILLHAVISVAVTTQLLSILCFRHSLTIGGEILIPVLVLLIRQAAIKIMDIFTEIENELINAEENQMKYPTKHQRVLLKKYGLNPKKWIITSENIMEMKAVHRYSGIVCVFNKKRGTDNE